MKTKLVITQKALLLVAGALLTLVGVFILASPVDFYAANDIQIGSNVSLLNELKAPAGFLFAAGLFMLVAVFVSSQADRAMALAALIYLSYAGSRSASIVADGVPASGLLQAAALEGAIGLACLVVLTLRRVTAGRVA